jgi:hypothetical protein
LKPIDSFILLFPSSLSWPMPSPMLALFPGETTARKGSQQRKRMQRWRWQKVRDDWQHGDPRLLAWYSRPFWR